MSWTPDELMESVEIAAKDETGKDITLLVDIITELNFSLEGGIYRRFDRPDGSSILMMHEDGLGNTYTNEQGNPGISVIGHILKRKHMFGVKNDDIYDIRQQNIISMKDRRHLAA